MPGTWAGAVSFVAVDRVATELESIARALRHKPSPGELPALCRRSLEAEQEARRLRVPDLVCAALMRRARVELLADRPEEALERAREARRSLGGRRQGDLYVAATVVAAEAAAVLERWPEVASLAREGIDLVECHRTRVRRPHLQAAYLRSRIALYALGARSAYLQGAPAEALRLCDLSKARGFFLRGRSHPAAGAEVLERQFRQLSEAIDRQSVAAPAGDEEALERLRARRRMLWDQLSILGAGARGWEVPELAVDRLRRRLCPDEAVLYYFWLSRHELLIATLDRQGEAVELRSLEPSQRAELDAYAGAVLGFGAGGSRRGLNHLEAVAGAIWPRGAAARLLEGKRRLLVSPHRVLHAIPFCALPVGGEPLVERLALTHVPNLASLGLAIPRRRPRAVLAAGIRTYRVPGAPPIDNAAAQVGAVREAWADAGGQVVTLLDDQVEAWLGTAAPPPRGLDTFQLIHLSLHGENVNGDSPLEARLLLRDSYLDGLEIAGLALDSPLVVLNACCSGQRAIAGRGMEELPGDDLFGLQAAFFQAGASRVIAPLWPIEAGVALKLARRLHGELRRDTAPDLALQAALRGYLAGAGGFRERWVYFWGSYFLSAMGRESEEESE